MIDLIKGFLSIGVYNIELGGGRIFVKNLRYMLRNFKKICLYRFTIHEAMQLFGFMKSFMTRLLNILLLLKHGNLQKAKHQLLILVYFTLHLYFETYENKCVHKEQFNSL